MLTICELFRNLQNAEEGFLRKLDRTDLLHALLSFFLLLEKFALSRNVTAVAFGNDVLSERLDRIGGNNL